MKEYKLRIADEILKDKPQKGLLQNQYFAAAFGIQ